MFIIRKSCKMFMDKEKIKETWVLLNNQDKPWQGNEEKNNQALYPMQSFPRLPIFSCD